MGKKRGTPASVKKKESAGKKIKLDQPPPVEKCPICLEEFEVPDRNDQLRILPCTDVICHECLVHLIANKGHRLSTIKCPKCQQQQPLYPDPYERTQPAVLAELYPTRMTYMKALKRNELLTNSCTQCEANATDICLICGLQCEKHNEMAHEKYPNHSHQSITAAAEMKQQEEKEEVDKVLSCCPDLIREFDKVQTKWSDEGSICIKGNKHLAACLERAEAELVTMKKLQTQVSKWVEQLKARNESLASEAEERNKERRQFLSFQRTKIEKIKELSFKEAKRKVKESDELFQVEPVHQVELEMEEYWKSHQPHLSQPHPAVEFTENILKPTLLPSLLPTIRAKLRQFLRQSGQTISNRNEMIYKASWHGWMKEDFMDCCADKSRTLILVQVADTGYIFGVYIEPEWLDEDGSESLPDLTQKSFVFSLTNVYDHPIRLSLTNPFASAIVASPRYRSVRIGEQVTDDTGEVIGWCNMELFSCGRPMNHQRGILINCQNDDSFVYQLDEESKKSAPEGFELNELTFSGSQYCGASEIEVYQL